MSNLSSTEAFEAGRTDGRAKQGKTNELLQRFGRQRIGRSEDSAPVAQGVGELHSFISWPYCWWVAGAIALLAGLPQLGFSTWAMNVINGVFSFRQEHRSQKAAKALQLMVPRMVRVLRSGEERRIDAEELVPGDLMLLAEGKRACAGARVVQASMLQVDPPL
jgi:magnesium-transporting ATPase (P-type)